MKPSYKDIGAYAVQAIAIIVMGALAWKYDHEFIWMVMITGGALCGLNLRKYLPGATPAEKTTSTTQTTSTATSQCPGAPPAKP